MRRSDLRVDSKVPSVSLTEIHFNTIVLLALYLARRRALKFEGVRRRDSREVLLFRRPRHDETLEVENPELSAPQINAMTERLKELLRTEV